MYIFLHTQSNPQHMALFRQAPDRIYPYTDAILAQKNQINPDFFVDGIVMMCQNRIVGRIALYLNNQVLGNAGLTGMLGHYECIADPNISQRLLAYASEKLYRLGANRILGPCNGSTWDNYRFEIGQENQPFFSEPIHPSWYPQQWEAFGFRRAATYQSQLDGQMHMHPERSNHYRQKLAQEGLQIRNLNLDDFEGELKRIYRFCMRAFKQNYLFSPISLPHFKSKYLAAKGLIDPELVLIATNAQGHMVGLVFSMPDLYARTKPALIIKTLARKAGPKWKGLGHVLSDELYKRATEKGYEQAIHAFMIEQSASTRLSDQYFSGNAYRRYALYHLAA